MSERRTRLWLALRFKDLPLSALNAPSSPDKSVVVVERRRVVSMTANAAASGVRIGMDLTTAQLLSDCQVVTRDPACEQETLHRLCEQLYQFTPHIEPYRSRETAQSGLLLELSSCLKLFSGVKKLCEAILALLKTTGYEVAYGLAHSSTGAWLLSFDNHEIRGDETTALFIIRLNKLPIQVLADYPNEVDALGKMGFSTLGDLARQISANSVGSFTKRLGKDFAEVICGIYGIDQGFTQASLFVKPVESYAPEEYFHEEVQFDYPINIVDQIKSTIENLLHRLSDYLRKRQLACQHIQWRISDIHHRQEYIQVHSDTPQSDWRLLYDLTVIQLENKAIPFDIDCLELICHSAMPLQGSSQALDFSGGRKRRGSAQELSVTMAKLKARVGETAVHKVSYRDNPLPELSNLMIGLAEKSFQQLPAIHRNGLRPAWLFANPQIIENRQQGLYWHGYLTLMVGPERMVGNWWDEKVARDYFLARRRDNLAVWAYLDLYKRQWYVHGVFA